MNYQHTYDGNTYNYYQSILQNRYALSKDNLLNACIGLQQHCNINHDDMLSVKLLEQLMLAYYEKSYPAKFGGIFEPLTKTIGYTHCLYLDPNKFFDFPFNKFRPKFNIYTNAIEDLPPSLQPEHIGEMIHLLHLICFIKNKYYDKHIAPLTFNNKGDLLGCYFSIRNNKLVIMRDYDGKNIGSNTTWASIYPACDIIIDEWHKYPTISQNKKLFVDHLNVRGNEAMKEILYTEFKLPDFRAYIKKNPYYFSVGPYSEFVKTEFSNIHFTRGIINIQENTGYDRATCCNIYQSYLSEYANLYDIFKHVFIISNGRIGSHDHAFSTFYGTLRTLIKYRYNNVVDYSPDQYSMGSLPYPDQILQEVTNVVHASNGDKILFALGLHGQTDGSATYEGGNFQKHHFDALFSLANAKPNFQLLLMSCWSGKKVNKISGNIIMNSSDQVSYSAYTNLFTEAFSRGNSLYEAHLYAMTEYHQSLLPTSYINEAGACIEICPLSRDFYGKPAGV